MRSDGSEGRRGVPGVGCRRCAATTCGPESTFSTKALDSAGERYLEFRAEAFNALNHPNWSPPGRNIADTNTFGIITGTVNAPRVVQLALKFSF